MNTEFWAFYCATFHAAAAWYDEHPSDELFFFLTAMEPVWPHGSTDAATWPEWLDLINDIDTLDDPVAVQDEFFASAADYIEMWGERDPPERSGVRQLADALRADDDSARALRAVWDRSAAMCRDDPPGVGGRYMVPAPATADPNPINPGV